ncbi:OprD family porin [Pseudomonas psychrophila]|uniref:Outer membrane porin, OprD family n=1 Tax=Pseudomonas psychrophila TaxID=122355 RepID=A0ABY0W158_9PSED|nr:OprD family porin [Pseudomonas psychrophila]KAB0491616.1 OprD family porin [Pseudomonas psychrophila]KMN00725.1 porin [Pseudomonas psychrophila]QIE34016.1 OprD family porin [Pseudomonas psychrophila]SDU67950.1 outer membrane porin, OprD family [Pseudomonas psychrophila]
MLKTVLRALSACTCVLSIGPALASGFIDDSHADLVMRNYYFDRNYVNATPQAAAREWAQGFILNLRSGYTEGPVGFGLDAQGLLGVRLDSSRARTGTGLLPYNATTREPADEYSELGLTAKARASKSELQLGTISTFLPIAFASPTRLLPQTFRGAYLKSQDIDQLTLHVGWLDRINLRDSTDYQKMSVGSPNGRFNGAAESNRFMFIGGDYAWSPHLTLKYYHAELAQLYRKDFYGLVDNRPMGPGSLKSDFRLFITGEDGAAKAGTVDNRNAALMLTYSLGAHKIGAGYMQLTGKSGMPYLFGTEPLVITEGTLSSEFLNPKERSWQVRYDYNFAAMGAPGLNGMLRYVSGDNIELARFGGSNLSESEKDIEVSYVLQSGPLKDLSLRLRNAWYRNDFTAQASHRDDNELRVNIDYTWKLW